MHNFEETTTIAAIADPEDFTKDAELKQQILKKAILVHPKTSTESILITLCLRYSMFARNSRSTPILRYFPNEKIDRSERHKQKLHFQNARWVTSCYQCRTRICQLSFSNCARLDSTLLEDGLPLSSRDKPQRIASSSVRWSSGKKQVCITSKLIPTLTFLMEIPLLNIWLASKLMRRKVRRNIIFSTLRLLCYSFFWQCHKALGLEGQSTPSRRQEKSKTKTLYLGCSWRNLI